jgi:ribose transport system permease protein
MSAQPAAAPQRLAGRAVPSRLITPASASALLLCVLIVVDVSIQPALLSLSQIGLVVQTALPLAFVAVAQTLVILIRGIDLSVGAVLVVADTLCASWIGADNGELWKLVPIVAAGALIGLVNGYLVAYARLEPFIATLATWTAFDGVALLIQPVDGGTVPTDLTSFATGSIGDVPVSVVLLACTLALWLYLKYTKLGWRIYGLGSDEARLALSGANTRRVKLVVYVLASMCAAVGGIYLAASTGTGTPGAGDSLVLPSVAAVVIGGTSLLGGRGGVGQTIIGVFVLTEISDITSGLALPAYTAVIASAIALLVVVALRSALGQGRAV